ncbi:MAG: DUF2621 family protein [Candidatus Omnitrophota bacterium]|nr:DUF2621 family protein [Candidatus Omnitrophota bacterium]
MMDINWNKDAETKFNQLIEKIPVFLRDVAAEKVSKSAQGFAQQENRMEMTEKDLVDALFKETPFGFHGPLKTDMQVVGIDYTKYGYEK